LKCQSVKPAIHSLTPKFSDTDVRAICFASLLRAFSEMEVLQRRKFEPLLPVRSGPLAGIELDPVTGLAKGEEVGKRNRLWFLWSLPAFSIYILILYFFTRNVAWMGLLVVWLAVNPEQRRSLKYVIQAGMHISTTVFSSEEEVGHLKYIVRKVTIPRTSDVKFTVVVRQGDPVDIDFFTPPQLHLFEVGATCSLSRFT